MVLFQVIVLAVDLGFSRNRPVENDDKEAQNEQDNRRRSLCAIKSSIYYAGIPFCLWSICAFVVMWPWSATLNAFYLKSREF